MKKGQPKYYHKRIFFTALIIYLFIKIPISTFLFFNQSADLIYSHILASNENVEVEKQKKSGLNISIQSSELEKKQFDVEENRGKFLVFVLCFIAALLGLIIYNRPFKKYFRKKRKGQLIPAKLQDYCRNNLLKTPLINSSFIVFPFVASIMYASIKMFQGNGLYANEDIRNLIQLNLYVEIVLALLVTLFSYQWQKTRLQLKYIDRVFSFDELKSSIFRKTWSIHSKLWMSQAVTTFLPLVIVVLYMSLSFTLVKDLGLETYTESHNRILLGEYYKIFSTLSKGNSTFHGGAYINSIDSFLMLTGISFSVIMALVYAVTMAKWTSRSIEVPVKELLSDMNTTGEGDIQSYSVVRSNDEIGQLTEGYNLMVQKLRRYFNELRDMNLNLEKKVVERTKEIRQQKEEIEAQRDEITQQRDQLSDKNKEINDSIFYAKNIQEAVLPVKEQFDKNLPEHFILFRPRDIVSGDFYWTKTIGDSVIFTAADCTGHGVPGAFMSMLGITYLNEIVHGKKKLQPNLILNELRTHVKTALKQESQQTTPKDGMDMALALLHKKTLVLEYAGAYNPLYLIRNGEVQRYKADRMPIGTQVKEKDSFTNHTIQLQHGDVIYLFSDGYVDQFGGPAGKKFGYKKFRQLLIDIHQKPASEQEAILEQNLEAWMANKSQVDDILVLGVKIHSK
jgi:serine phosphatase RsbU (regulator of sigma subunit)